MPDFPYDAEIDPQRLLVDEQNPRLPDETRNQRDALRKMADHQGAKLLSLAKHVAENGLNPAQRFIVIPEGDPGEDYVVLDGNRRLVALMALETPTAFALPPRRVATLKRLGDEAAIPETISCVVFRDRQQAEPWIRLTHLNQRGGVGQSKWSSAQKARHEYRLGAKPVTLQLLDFVRANASLSSTATKMIDAGTFPMTIIERMLETRDARPHLGIDVRGGVVSTPFPRDQVLKPLTGFIEDVARGEVDSRRLNTAKQRVDYVSQFRADRRPDPATRADNPVPLDEAPATTRASRTPRTRRDRPNSATRAFVIPSSVNLQIPIDKVHDIYLELKTKVRADDTPYAAGSLLRVFLELSIAAYCKRKGVATRDGEYLRENFTAASARMVKDGDMTQRQINTVRSKLLERETGFATLQAILHNPDLHVTGLEVKRIWDGLAPYFAVLWS